MKIILKSIIALSCFVLIWNFIPANLSIASTTDGTIDSTYKYAWGENIGWINFGCDNCNAHVTDSGLSGYALGENTGWIYLSDVVNDNEGNLSGYAWGENIGWIKFNPTNGGVIINSSGEFTGSALSENVGWIIFGGDYKVKTDWRPASSRIACNNGLDDDSDGQTDYPNDTGCTSISDTDETNPATGGTSSGSYLPGRNPYKPEIVVPETKIETIVDNIGDGIKETSKEIINKIIPDFLKPEKQEEEIPTEEIVRSGVPQVFSGAWNILPRESINNFVLDSLPADLLRLANKFPDLGDTLKKVGVHKITDIEKLMNANLVLPGLTEISGLPHNVSLANLTPESKAQIPSEIIFARTGGQLIDFNMALSVDDKGKTEQKIRTIVGKPLHLIVKLDNPAKSVKGYVVLKSTAKESDLSLREIISSKLFASSILAYPEQKPVLVENKLVLLEFEYTDPDNDGFYTADIDSSLVEGEYEIITVLDFEDPNMGKKEIRLITVVDPEGYIYTNSTLGKVRIEGATASLYWFNGATRDYDLWKAREYQQINPQITDDTGKYSFLVPPGKYYLKVEHARYNYYQSEIFEVTEGSGVHMNIELKAKGGWLFRMIDWKIILVVILGVLLIYIFYRDKIREKFFRNVLEDKLKV